MLRATQHVVQQAFAHRGFTNGELAQLECREDGIEDGHAGAAAREEAGDGLPDPRRTARDDGDAPAEVVNGRQRQNRLNDGRGGGREHDHDVPCVCHPKQRELGNDSNHALSTPKR